MGKIYPSEYQDYPPPRLNGLLTVTERSAQFENTIKVLLEQKVSLVTIGSAPLTDIKFAKPIIVKTHNQYDVQILFGSGWHHGKYFTEMSPFVSEVQFGEKHKVTFSRNSDVHYDNCQYGLISDLYFNSYGKGVTKRNWSEVLFFSGTIGICLFYFYKSITRHISSNIPIPTCIPTFPTCAPAVPDYVPASYSLVDNILNIWK